MASLLKRVAMAANAPIPEAALDRFGELNRLERLATSQISGGSTLLQTLASAASDRIMLPQTRHGDS
jgi:hypothetical protein